MRDGFDLFFGKSIGYCLLLVACGAGIRDAAAQTPRLAEQAFKNIQVLKGVPEDKIQPTM
jgi:hypothetical protein